MGDILPFVARVRASGDWSAAERARLQDLADQFSTGAGRVEVVFGTTEEGDPWCVVKDDQEEVLVHVARIGGKFVVHYAVEDAMEEGADLHAALSDRLVAAESADDVVVPFSVGGRHAQTFIALVVAAAFFYETQDVAAAAEAEDEPLQMQQAPDEAEGLPASDDLGVRQDRELVTNGSVFVDPAPTPPSQTAWAPAAEYAAPSGGSLAAATAAEPAASAAAEPPSSGEDDTNDKTPALTMVEARNEIIGTDGDDLLVGTEGADLIRGGAGQDTLQGGGAAQGQLDILEGGAGDDRIELTGQVVATGGQGADTFVVQAPQVMGQSSTMLGVLTDFNEVDGDRLVNARGEVLTLGRPTPPAPPAQDPQTEMQPSLTAPSTGPGRQVEVDLDGDGQMDGYVVMAHASAQAIYELPRGGEPLNDEAILLIGRGFDYTDFI
jgi:hypothetical protein